MATTRAKALRRSGIDARIAAAGQTLAARFGIEPAPPGPHQRDPDLAILAERERMADLLDAIVAATDPDAEPYALDLSKLSRVELNGYAWERRIADPESYPTKAALIAAIEAQEGPGRSMDANEKPNRGQDTNVHTFTNPDTGEERAETMRWFRSEGRAAGFRKADGDDDEAGDEAEEAAGGPAVAEPEAADDGDGDEAEPASADDEG